MAPDDGNRWLGIQFQLVNKGDKAYQDSPTNGMQVADADGQMFQTTFGEITASTPPSLPTCDSPPEPRPSAGSPSTYRRT